MSEFDKRKQGFEKFFELSEALRFKALSRRNRAVGRWAAEKLGLTGEAAERYAEDFGKVQIEGEDDETLIARLHDEFVKAGDRRLRPPHPPQVRSGDERGDRRDRSGAGEARPLGGG